MMLILCGGCSSEESNEVTTEIAEPVESEVVETAAEVYNKMFDAMHEKANYTVELTENVVADYGFSNGTETYARKFITYFDYAPAVDYDNESYNEDKIRARIDNYAYYDEGDDHTEITFYLYDGKCYLDLADDRSGLLIEIAEWLDSVESMAVTALAYTPEGLEEDAISFVEEGNTRKIRLDIESGFAMEEDTVISDICYQLITLNDEYLPVQIEFCIEYKTEEGIDIVDNATLIYSDWGTTDIHWDTITDVTEEVEAEVAEIKENN